jgi:hypothetical protein
MTLIAMAISGMPPTMTADVLITSFDGELGVRLPNRPMPLAVEEVQHLTYKPDKLLQKLYVIQSNVCMCVAGRVYELKLILDDFRNFCSWKSNEGKSQVNFEEIRDFFSSYDEDILKQVVLGIAIAIDQENGLVFTPDIHKSAWQGDSSNEFGAVLAAGSGAEQYLKHITWHKLFGSSHQPGEFMYVKQVNFSFITKFLCKENLSLKSLEDYWGGFLETCFFNGKCFEKVGNVAFVISDAATDDYGNMTTPVPKLFIYSQYLENVLYLTTVEASDFQIDVSEDSISFISKHYSKSLFPVEEIDAKCPPSALYENDNLSFISTKVALGINVKITVGVHLPISAYTEGEDVKVEYVDGESIKFIWPVHLHEKLSSMVKESYPMVKNAIDGNNPSDSVK